MEEEISGGVDTINFNICIERVSKYIEEKPIGRNKSRRDQIWTSKILLKRKFRRVNDKSAKVAELKWVEQESKIIEELIQEFKRAVRGSKR